MMKRVVACRNVLQRVAVTFCQRIPDTTDGANASFIKRPNAKFVPYATQHDRKSARGNWRNREGEREKETARERNEKECTHARKTERERARKTERRGGGEEGDEQRT